LRSPQGAIGIGLIVGGLCACGIQGPPVPPEDIGVAHKVYIDQQREAKAREKAREEELAREAQPQPERETEMGQAPYDGAVQPGARPSGDVQVRPR
jgi:hypothetical protein